MTGIMCALLGAVGGPPASLSLVVSPSTLYNSRTGNGLVTSPSATATPSGGTGPYTYAWSFVAGDVMTVNSPSSAATTFTATVLAGNLKSATYRCIVTDSLSNNAFADVSIDLEAF